MRGDRGREEGEGGGGEEEEEREKEQTVLPGPGWGKPSPSKLADLASTSLWSRTCPLTHMMAGIPISLDSCQQEIPRTKLSAGRLLKLLFI